MKKHAICLLLIMIIFLNGCNEILTFPDKDKAPAISEEAHTSAISDQENSVNDKAQSLSKNDEIITEDIDTENNSESEETSKPSTNIENAAEDWGTFSPDGSENDYVKAIKEIEGYTSKGLITQTYEADYDGTGGMEAFVLMGEYSGSDFSGDLWYVDEDLFAYCLERDLYAYMEQVYYKKDGRAYLFFTYNMGNYVNTDVYSINGMDNAENLSADIPGQKFIDDNGMVIVLQEAYDAYYDRYQGEKEGMWTGHTWKFYPFYFMADKLIEVEAIETTYASVDKMAPLPDEALERIAGTIDKPVAEVQYIYREKTRELIINIAYDLSADGNISYHFENLMYRLTKEDAQSWEFVEENTGIYQLQYSKESFWAFTDSLSRAVPEGKEYINEYLSILHKYKYSYPEFEDYMCDLIYFDDDEIPELIIGQSGYWVSMYTYKEGKVYELMDMWAYGAFGNVGYEYIPYQNVLRNYNSDYAGMRFYTSYSKISENHSLEEDSYSLIMSYEDENGQVIIEYTEETYDENNWHYYYNDKEITKEEYDSYIIQGEFQYIEGTQAYYPFEGYLLSLLDSEENISE